MRTVIGEHELTNITLHLFNPDGSLINSGVGKSSAADEILKFANTKPLIQVPHDFPVCYVRVMLASIFQRTYLFFSNVQP